jgi:hypothetical protein
VGVSVVITPPSVEVAEGSPLVALGDSLADSDAVAEVVVVVVVLVVVVVVVVSLGGSTRLNCPLTYHGAASSGSSPRGTSSMYTARLRLRYS